MPQVKNVEKKIGEVEGFNIVIKQNGVNVRSDREGLPQYTMTKAAKGSMTVAEWKEKRFKPQYPGFDVDILDGDGNICSGQTLLSTVRATYQKDDKGE